MQDITDGSGRKKRGAVLSAVVTVLAVGAVLAAVVLPLIREAWGHGAATAFLVVYGLVLAAILAGVVVALRQRLRELDAGEEEDAKQY